MTITRAGGMTRCKRLTFWGADEQDDSLVRSVIAGHKTVTADTVDAWYQSYGEYGDGSYATGDEIDVHDGQRRLRCRIKATKVERIRFGAIPEAVWRGENFASAAAFRACHVACMPHLDLHDDVAFIAMHFALVEVILP